MAFLFIRFQYIIISLRVGLGRLGQSQGKAPQFARVNAGEEMALFVFDSFGWR